MFRIMQKKLSLLLVGAMLLCTFASCSSTQKEDFPTSDRSAGSDSETVLQSTVGESVTEASGSDTGPAAQPLSYPTRE